MTKVQELERLVNELTPAELAQFRRWFSAFDAAAWDRQFEADVNGGKLDGLAERALAAHAAVNHQALNHYAAPEFWTSYTALPISVQRLADKSFDLMKSDPRHPSLRLISEAIGSTCRLVARMAIRGNVPQVI